MTFKERFEDLLFDDICNTVIISSREDYVVMTNLLQNLECKCKVDTYKENSIYVMNIVIKERYYNMLVDLLNEKDYVLADTTRTGSISKMLKIH